jgi:hypothetical protein
MGKLFKIKEMRKTPFPCPLRKQSLPKFLKLMEMIEVSPCTGRELGFPCLGPGLQKI